MRKVQKGCYGYVAYKRKNQVIITIISFLLPLSLFFIGWYTTKTKMNLLTIVAVLGLLPASKMAVNMIMMIKSKGCTECVKQRISDQKVALKHIYDLNITTYQKEFQISNLSVRANIIIAFTEDIKMNTAPIEKYIKESLDNNGYKGYQFKVFLDLNKYIERREQLLKLDEDKREDAVLSFLMGLSL